MEDSESIARKRKRASGNTWDDWRNHRLAVKAIRKRVGADVKVEKWYNVSRELLVKMGLGGLLGYYDDSIAKLLEANMPSWEWDMLLPWKFRSHVTYNYWKNEDNHQLAFESLRTCVGADEDVEMWYTVTAKMLHAMGRVPL